MENKTICIFVVDLELAIKPALNARGCFVVHGDNMVLGIRGFYASSVGYDALTLSLLRRFVRSSGVPQEGDVTKHQAHDIQKYKIQKYG